MANVASFFKVPIISWVATDPDLNDKVTFSTLSRTLGPFSKLGEFLLEIFAQYNWRRVVVVSSNYLLYMDAAKAIKLVFRNNNITVAYETEYERYPSQLYINSVLKKAQIESRSKCSRCANVSKLWSILRSIFVQWFS